MQFATHLPAYVYRVSFQRYRPLKLRLSCEILEKGGFWLPICKGGGDTPDFGHAFPNCTYLRQCDRIWFSSVQRVWRLEVEKKKKEKKKKESKKKERIHGKT